MKRGEEIRDAKCEECGDTIRFAIVREGGQIICSACMNAGILGLGASSSGHYEDDPSGASGSWDAAVKRYEEN